MQSLRSGSQRCERKQLRLTSGGLRDLTLIPLQLLLRLSLAVLLVSWLTVLAVSTLAIANSIYEQLELILVTLFVLS